MADERSIGAGSFSGEDMEITWVVFPIRASDGRHPINVTVVFKDAANRVEHKLRGRFSVDAIDFARIGDEKEWRYNVTRMARDLVQSSQQAVARRGQS